MRKLTKTKFPTLREARINRLRFLDDLFHLAEDVENPDDLFLIRILGEAHRLDNLINKSNEICLLENVKIELNNLPVNKTIEKKACLYPSSQRNGRKSNGIAQNRQIRQTHGVKYGGE